MTVGLASGTANSMLDVLRGAGNGVTFTADALQYVQLHTADPGAAGTTAVSAVTTRQAGTWSAASGGSQALTSSPTAWSMTTTETISHISRWTASSAGTFRQSVALTASKAVVNGDTLTLTSFTTALTPIAA